MEYSLCNRCHTAYPSSDPSAEALAAAYSADYYGSGGSKFGDTIERFRKACARVTARRLCAQLPPAATILDIGCGDGTFLELIRRYHSGPLHGLEPPGASADRAALKQGINLHCSFLNESALPPASFDLITLRHVFEHLADPVAAIHQISRLTRNNGAVYLSLPNIQSWQARWFKGDWFHLDPPRHLNLPPAATLIQQFNLHGFTVIELDHWSLEQNLYGWLQSCLNALDSRRNFFYERLKGNKNYLPHRGPGAIAAHAMIATALVVPALLLDTAALLVRRGPTLGILLRKTN